MTDRYLGFMSGKYTGINDDPPEMQCDGNAENFDKDDCRGCCSYRECMEEQEDE